MGLIPAQSESDQLLGPLAERLAGGNCPTQASLPRIRDAGPFCEVSRAGAANWQTPGRTQMQPSPRRHKSRERDRERAEDSCGATFSFQTANRKPNLPLVFNRNSKAAAGQRRAVALPIALGMIAAIKIYFVIFGILTIAGGIMGYVNKGSVASIIAGTVTGILLLVAAFLLPAHTAAALSIAGVISLLLAGQFVPKLISTGQVMPAGIMSVLSVLGIIAAIAAWFGK